MRKALVLAISSLFFYSLFRDMTLLNTLLLCFAIAFAYGISKIPSKYLAGAKYPLVALSLALCPILIVYPWLRHRLMVAALAMFLAFFSTTLFLVSLDEKEKRLYKQVTGLALLYAAAALNLFLAHHSELILSFSISILIFLFIINKAQIMPFVGAFTLLVLILLLISGVHILAPAVYLQGVERYALLASAFALLFFVFAAYVKRPDFATILPFFGLLYVSVDLLLSIGFRVKGVLLYQPFLALFIVGPVVGVALKGGKERL